MIWLLGLCTILLTEPYAPRPISPKSLRSSAVKSQCCSGEIFSFPDDSILCVLSLSLATQVRCCERRSHGILTRPNCGLTHMCGFWKGGPAVFRVNLVVGLMGGLAKFSLRALRLPERGEGEEETVTWSDVEMTHMKAHGEWKQHRAWHKGSQTNAPKPMEVMQRPKQKHILTCQSRIHLSTDLTKIPKPAGDESLNNVCLLYNMLELKRKIIHLESSPATRLSGNHDLVTWDIPQMLWAVSQRNHFLYVSPRRQRYLPELSCHV